MQAPLSAPIQTWAWHLISSRNSLSIRLSSTLLSTSIDAEKSAISLTESLQNSRKVSDRKELREGAISNRLVLKVAMKTARTTPAGEDGWFPVVQGTNRKHPEKKMIRKNLGFCRVSHRSTHWFSDFRLELSSHILSASNSDLITSFKTQIQKPLDFLPTSSNHPFPAQTRQKQWTPRAGVKGDSRALFEPPEVPSGNQTCLVENPLKKGHFKAFQWEDHP